MNYLLFYETTGGLFPIRTPAGSMNEMSKDVADQWMRAYAYRLVDNGGDVVAFHLVPLDAVSCVDNQSYSNNGKE